MYEYQAAWFEQVRADHQALLLLRRSGAAPCAQLHYLQMVTEKLGKAYFWRTRRPPRTSHASFVRFLQALDKPSRSEVARTAEAFGFGDAEGFRAWIPTIAPLAYDIERLAPQLAGLNNPNAEYPWPAVAPVNCPATYDFPVWWKLTDTGRGRQFLKVIDAAVVGFPTYA